MFRLNWWLVFVLLIFVLMCTTSSNAQESLFETMFDEGGRALLERRYPEAEKKLKAALREAEQFPPSDVRLQRTIQTLAELYDEEKKFDLSEPLYKRLLDNDEKNNPAKKRTLAGDYDKLASNLQRQGKYEQAISFYLKAKDLFTQADKEGVETTATTESDLNAMKVENRVVSLIRLASAYSELGKTAECEKALREALTVAEGSDDAIAAGRVFDALGRHYTTAGRYDEADAVLNQAQTQKKKIQDVGIRRLEISNTALLFGQLFRAQGKINDALQSIQLSYKMRAGSLEDNDPRIYEPLLVRASIYRDLTCYKDAVAELEKGRVLVEKSFGDESPRYAEFLRQLAADYVSCSQYAKADPLLRKALSIDELAYGKDARQVVLDLNAMGMYYIYQGKYTDAEPIYKRALEVTEKNLGPDHVDVAAALNSLAWLYSNQRRFEEARPLIERGLAIREKALGNEHPVVARNMHNLANVLISEQKLDQAQQLLLRTLKIQKSVLGPEHEDTVATMRDLADLLKASNKFADSEEYFRAILKSDQKTNEPGSAIVAADLENLARVLIETSREDEAKPLIAQAKEIKLKLPGYNDSNQGHAITLGVPKTGIATAKPVADKWALVVGLSNFKDPAINLQFAAKDAMDFRNYLIFEANFKPDHVKLLLDEHATRDNIISHLGDKWLRKNAKNDDLVVIYVSTHGTSARKDVGNANFIVAYETNLNNAVLSGIPMQFFTAGVRDMIPSQRVVIVMDVCHGGAIRENSLATAIGAKEKETHHTAAGSKAIILQPDMRVKASTAAGTHPGALSVGTGQIVVASSDSDQVSWESRLYPNGVFTRQLIEALRTRGPNTTVQEAYKIMRAKVEQEVLRSRAEIQTPILALHTWHGAEAVLGVKPAAPRNVAVPASK
ncbi:MAG: tetratricopeptide repeat protein [Candidatus Melainabacteria bacterium]|nr:tetratricopeptide repeat protein [Candidatus Melainabacteria bacterium]